MALAMAATLLFSLSAVAGASAAHKHARGHKHAKAHKKTRRARKASAPMTGIYDACAFSAQKTDKPLPDCGDRLTVLHQGGFQVVLNYWTSGMSIAENLRYADEAQAVGMKVIWNLEDTNSLQSKLELVRATSSHPATWGYYIGDEVDPADRDKVADLSGAVRALTNRPLLYVSRPNPGKLRPFKGLADYIGPDDYPVGPMDRPVCQTARWASRMVKNNLTMVLQAYSWSIDFPGINPQWPSAGQMRQMRNQAMRCGNPKLLLWFCFHCVTDYNPNPDSYWRELAWAANGVSLNPTYRMTSAGTASG
ncbi:MAG: hypothetical protein ACJ75Z_08805 [Solirubrobacterales bacterium]